MDDVIAIGEVVPERHLATGESIAV